MFPCDFYATSLQTILGVAKLGSMDTSIDIDDSHKEKNVHRKAAVVGSWVDFPIQFALAMMAVWLNVLFSLGSCWLC